MPRVKKGVKGARRRKRILKAAKGFRAPRSNLLRPARETVQRAWVYAYRDRRNKKRTIRNLWIVRINAATRELGMSYNTFIYGIKRAGIAIDRKMLAHLAVSAPETFSQLVEQAKTAIAN